MNHPVITLLSDLGTRDTSVAVVKAAIKRHVPDALIVDISHNVAQYDLQQAAYLLLSAYRHFPQGTIHVLLVDVFSGEVPRMLLAEKDGYLFIAPDNGILPLAFGTELQNVRKGFDFARPYTFMDWINKAGKVSTSIKSNDGTGAFEVCEVKNMPRLLQPKILPDGIECNILYIDRYENIVLGITKAQFEDAVKNKPFKIRVTRTMDVTAISNNYNDVKSGEPLCRFNDAGFMEIALNHDRAASLLGMGTGSNINLRYQTIKIFF